MKIHWLAITIFSSREDVLSLWDKFFELELGSMVETPRGGRGFQNVDVALHEAKLYYNPVQQSDIAKDYCHLEFTGSACDSVIPTHFRDLVDYLLSVSISFKITRLDVAWDNLSFSPEDFYQSVCAELVTSPAKRTSLSFVSSPYEVRENGEAGCHTCYFGSKSSHRLVRVYNKRGGTRLELVCRDDRAHAVALDIFDNLYSDWDFVAREHLLDYIDFPTWSLWQDFIKHAKQAYLVITPARKVALTKIQGWLERQVSVALSVFYDVHGWKEAQIILDRILLEAANSRDRSRYSAVLAMRPPYENLKSLNVPDIHSYIDFDLDTSPLAYG